MRRAISLLIIDEINLDGETISIIKKEKEFEN